MSAAGSREAIEQALLAYQRGPGNYAVGLRQPAVLFGALRDVLQLAGGRSEAGAPSPALRQAAVFFVRSALLAPGADHYVLLGLPRDADTAAIKERYRLLMRLLHPDFAGTLPTATWPPDAAARVNLAHDVLLSPVRRREYDERQQSAAKPQPAPARPAAHRVPVTVVAQPPHRANPRGLLKLLAAGFGTAGLLALLATLLATLQDRPDLVQRAAGDADPARGPARGTRPSLAEIVALSMPTAAPAAQLPRPEEPARLPNNPLQVGAPATVALPAPPLRLPPIAPPPLPVPAQRPARAEAASPATAPPAAALPPTQAMAPLNAPPAAVLVPASVAPAAMPVSLPAARPNPGVTMAEVHPILSKLLQQLESGAGERVIGLLDRDARAAPAAQALLRQYNGLVEGARQVKVANAQFRAEPQDGRLVVIGQVLMQVGDPQAGTTPREFAVQAEFAVRDGSVVMTQLSRANPVPGERRP